MQQHFSFVTVNNGLARALINQVSVWDPVAIERPAPKDLPRFNAIWDTGATNTCISKRVAEQCGLEPTGMTTASGVSGVSNRSTYLISLMLPNKVGIENLRVIDADLGEGNDLLIGMDIISRGDFAVSSHGGQTVFSFRVPSAETIDFVRTHTKPLNEMLANVQPKIKRNSKCPCGSGKKYKQCCGA